MRKTNLKSKKGKSSDNESVVDDANENGEEDTIASRGSISGDEEDKPELKKKRARKSGPVQGKEDDAFVKEVSYIPIEQLSYWILSTSIFHLTPTSKKRTPGHRYFDEHLCTEEEVEKSPYMIQSDPAVQEDETKTMMKRVSADRTNFGGLEDQETAVVLIAMSDLEEFSPF
uniref:Uncharacterized protein n=1 Tax=Timema shepardi TaxID=629360 RepID=A0A7R9G252_TIMSH|nr:unnamed protein product [Timema shepardi]